MPKKTKEYPAFLDTQKLREVVASAATYASATGNGLIFNYAKAALIEAEKWEKPEKYSECRECGEEDLCG